MCFYICCKTLKGPLFYGEFLEQFVTWKFENIQFDKGFAKLGLFMKAILFWLYL